MSTRALRRLATAALGLGALLLAAGCGLKGSIAPNAPPETSVFVSGDLDTVSHTVHLYWSGTDVDGTVKGFQWRFFNTQRPADTTWAYTTRKDSLFVVWDTTGYERPTFQVRSIDDANAVDPTPATQAFQFSNKAPTVQLTVKPVFADSTFASTTITWQAADIDGDPNALQFRIWLDGAQDTPHFVTGRTYTVPSSDFGVPGTYASRYRTLYIQAIDDGGRPGNIDSTRWFVRAPTTGTRARLLIVDDVPASNSANTRIDTLYANTAARNLAADEYSILRIRTTQPFRSAADVAQTFDLFDAVVWYRGNETVFSTVLNSYQSGIRTYLASGGKFYIDGLYLVAGKNASGFFDPSFAIDVLGASGLATNFNSAVFDSSNGFGNANPSVFYTGPVGGAPTDSVRQQTLPARPFEAGGTRWFLGVDPANVLLWGRPGALSPPNAEVAAVGLSVPQPGGGRCVFLTIPLGTSTLFPGTPAFNAAPRVLASIFGQLGLTSP